MGQKIIPLLLFFSLFRFCSTKCLEIVTKKSHLQFTKIPSIFRDDEFRKYFPTFYKKKCDYLKTFSTTVCESC